MDCSNCCPCLPVVERCCCCHSLQTGTKIIAIFEIVYNLILIASEGTLMAYLPAIVQASAGFDVLLDVMMVVASVLLLIALNSKMMELVNLWLVCEFIFIASGAIHCLALLVELLIGQIPADVGTAFLLFHFVNEGHEFASCEWDSPKHCHSYSQKICMYCFADVIIRLISSYFFIVVYNYYQEEYVNP